MFRACVYPYGLKERGMLHDNIMLISEYKKSVFFFCFSLGVQNGC